MAAGADRHNGRVTRPTAAGVPILGQRRTQPAVDVKVSEPIRPGAFVMVPEAAVPRDPTEAAEWFVGMSAALSQRCGHQAFTIFVLPAGVEMEAINRDDAWFVDVGVWAARVQAFEAIGHLTALAGEKDCVWTEPTEDGAAFCVPHRAVAAPTPDGECPVGVAREWIRRTQEALDRQAVTGGTEE